MSAQNFRILLVEPAEKLRDRYLDYLNRGNFSTDVTESSTEEQVIPLLEANQFDLCIIGAGFEYDYQKLLLEKVAVSAPSGCAIVVHLAEKNQDAPTALAALGAHGTLSPPLNEVSFTQTISAALQNAANDFEFEIEDSGGFKSLPDLLENFADKLEEIAYRLKEEERGGTRVQATPKLIKEALLSTVALSGTHDEKALERVVQILLAGKSGEKEEL